MRLQGYASMRVAGRKILRLSCILRIGLAVPGVGEDYSVIQCCGARQRAGCKNEVLPNG